MLKESDSSLQRYIYKTYGGRNICKHWLATGPVEIKNGAVTKKCVLAGYFAVLYNESRNQATEETIMELLELMQRRRSIRKYLDQRVEKDKLDKIVEAGLFAPNPGGRQGTKILMLDSPALIEKIGIVNANCENRDWGGRGVSAEQPSIIDDLSIKSGFYGCTALGMVCVSKSFAKAVNGIGSAFVCAENMVLEAMELGVSSCIVGRAEATFTQPEMEALLTEWGLEEDYIPVVFVCLGYINGEYPKVKSRKDGRALYVTGE